MPGKTRSDEGTVLSNKQKLSRREFRVDHAYFTCLCLFIEGIKQINADREKKGKGPRYGKAKFETTFGNKVKAYSETLAFS